MYCLKVSTFDAEKRIVVVLVVLCTLAEGTKHDHRGLGWDWME